jgi:hypothetical protein
MDEAVDQSMVRSTDEKGADKAVAIRRGQAKERARLQAEIAQEQKNIAELNEQAAPIRAEVRKVEAEVGPLKYIAAFVYGATDESVLERAVTWVIITIIVVFDPLAVIMLLAAQMTFGWRQDEKEKSVSTGNFDPEPNTDDNQITADQTIQIEEEIGKHDTNQQPISSVWPFPSQQTVETVEVPGETPLTALGGDITATEEKPVEAVEDIPLAQWNKMIEEAEKAVEEEKKAQVEPDFPKAENVEESKKKTYMTKDETGKIQVMNRS